jgi:endonuclease-8
MVANVNKRSAARITTFSLDPRQTKYVFGRGGRSCRNCGTRIEYAKQGRDVRGTYWCPKCQG